MIYLDNAATTKIAEPVLEAMLPYLKEQYGNPGSLYALGRKAADAVDKAREQVADLINADPEQIIFTSGGSEANNLVFRGLYEWIRHAGKTEILISAVEHDSVFRAAHSLPGFIVKEIGVDKECRVDIGEFKERLSGAVGIASCLAINNETGTPNRVSFIAKMCSEMGVLFHTDCVQALSSGTVDAKKMGCDFISMSSHKIHGPKGVGALYVKHKSLIDPLIYGGSHQEFGLRGGTENVAGIVGFGAACELVKNKPGGAALKQTFLKSLVNKLVSNGIGEIVHINGVYPCPFTGNILNLRFDGIDAETLVLMADRAGICISAGSACRSHEQKPSRVLKAMGLSDEDAMQSVRISFSEYTNTIEEVSAAGSRLGELVAAMYLSGLRTL